MLENFGLVAVAAKYPHEEDLYVLSACKTLSIEPREVTHEQRRLAKAAIYGRLYGRPVEEIIDAMKDGQF